MSKWVVAVFLLSSVASGQYRNLSTTDDGSVLLFSSRLVMRGTNQPAWEKLFRLDASGVSLYAQRDREAPPESMLTNNYRLIRGELSGDGRVTALTAQADCIWPGSSCTVSQPKYRSDISGAPGQQAITVTGQARLSRNGRYAVICCNGALGSPTTLYDLATGESQKISAFLPALPAIASSGVIVVPDAAGFLRVFGIGSSREVPTSTRPVQAVVDDAGATAVYAGRAADGMVALTRVELQSGAETALMTGPRLALVGVSNRGDVVAFLGGAYDQTIQLYTMGTDGTGPRQATHDAAGIAEAVLAGGGGVAYAVTFAGRILRVDLGSGAVTEAIGRTVTLQVPSPSSPPEPVAGSAFCVGGTGLAESAAGGGGLRLLLDGQSAPILSAAPAQACLQIPWDTPAGRHTLDAVADSDARFEGETSGVLEMDWAAFADFVGLDAQGLPVVAHQDFRGLVTAESPAVPGEILNFYMTGLGPVTRDFPAVVTSPFACRLSTFTPAEPKPVEVLFAGLAPGIPGYYQVSVRLPDEVPTSYGRALFACNVGGPYAGESAWIPVAGTP